MPRVKSGKVSRRRRKKILKLSKGYFGSKRTLYRTANEQVMRSLNYQYRDRKQRKRDFRKLWITRINAGAKLNGMKYSTLIHGLSLANVEINRKVLADLAVNNPDDFKMYCEIAEEALNGKMFDRVVNEEIVTNGKTKPKAEVKAEPNKVEEIVVDYSKMLVKDLKELAKEHNIEGYSSMLKADLVKALENL